MRKFIILPGKYSLNRDTRFEDKRVYNPTPLFVSLDSIDKVEKSTTAVDDGQMAGQYKMVDVVKVYRHFGRGDEGEIIFTHLDFWGEFMGITNE